MMNRASATRFGIQQIWKITFVALLMTLISPLVHGKSFISVCDRSKAVRFAIQKEVGDIRFEQGRTENVRCDRIRPDELSSIIALFLYKQNIRVLKLGDFSGLDGLQYLDLGENDIGNLPAAIFWGLDSLKAIQLSDNRFTRLGLQFYKLPQLKYIFLYGNEMKAISSSAFSYTPSLEVLNLSRNKLSKAPNLSNNRRLRHVDLSHNAKPLSFNTQGNASTNITDVANTLLKTFVLNHWHMPLSVGVRLSKQENDNLLAAHQGSVEEKWAVRQLVEFKNAYRRAAFDFMAVDIRFEGDNKPEVVVKKGSARVKVILPSFDPSQKKGDRDFSIVSAESILDALSNKFKWNWLDRWYEGKATRPMILATIRRDLVKFERLEHQLRVDNRRLADLVAQVKLRSDAAKGSELYTPSELEFARLVQIRTIFYLNRVLNTLARWRAAREDENFPYPEEIRMILLWGSHIYRGYLGWFLDTVTGGRAIFNVFSSSWRNRNKLYVVLDGAVEAGNVNLDGRRSQKIPAGSVQSMISMRLSVSLNRWLSKLDKKDYKALSKSTFSKSPIKNMLRKAKRSMKINRGLQDKHKISGFRAWKELWDARIKNGVTFPFYHLVRVISTLIGDTRLKHPAPSVTPAQLREMEETLLMPGDIILVRQDYYLSNHVIPGFWTHSILYLGKETDWAELKLANGQQLIDNTQIRERILPAFRQSSDGHPNRVLEAISEGVVFSSMEHALGKDYIVILRPSYPKHIQEHKNGLAISKALRFHGRPYDFDFNFETDDKIVCTELVYRAHNKFLKFDVHKYAPRPKPEPTVPGIATLAGRTMLSPDDIVRYFLYMINHPNPNPKINYPGKVLTLVQLYEKDEEGGTEAKQSSGAEGIQRLRASLER